MKNKTIFVDTGAWIALSDVSDQYHQKASSHLKLLISDVCELITTNLIVHETFMLISRRIARKSAISFLDVIFRTDNVQILHNDRSIELEAFDTIRKYADQDFSIVDSVSFTIMKRRELKRVFTFDKHFRTMHFAVEP